MPTVLVAILAKDKEITLPFYLETLLAWDYPKNRITLYIQKNDSNDGTQQILDGWVETNGSLYANVVYHKNEINPEVKQFGVHDWDPTRFCVLGKIRESSLLATLENECDFYFVSDVDNYLTSGTLRKLVTRDLEIVSPFLKLAMASNDEEKNGANDKLFYSNYQNQVYGNRDFFETPLYREIWHQNVKGLIQLDFLHCTYLVRRDAIKSLYYLDGSDRSGCVIFAESAHNSGIPMYLDNSEIFGCLSLNENVDACREFMKQCN
jgi:hypothetical protein